jgi:hypothetical protein
VARDDGGGPLLGGVTTAEKRAFASFSCISRGASVAVTILVI